MTRCWAILAGLLLLATGCGGGETAVAGSFVGATIDGEIFVAVVAAEPTNGSDEREVRVYACDGATVAQWLPGTTTGNSATITNDAGANAQVTLAADGAEGTITLPDGRALQFTAAQASGPAGLYDVTLSADGSVQGSADTGGRLDGRLEERDGQPAVVATLTAADDATFDVRMATTSSDPADFRVIVQPDGQLRGATKGGPETSWIINLPDF